MTDTIFGAILRGEIPCDSVYEDDHVLAFRDINPAAPTHVLVIPKKPIATLNDATAEDRALLGSVMLAATEVARAEGIAEDGYRVVMNVGAGGGQTVFHIHLHVLGGRPFSWPPG